MSVDGTAQEIEGETHLACSSVVLPSNAQLSVSIRHTVEAVLGHA